MALEATHIRFALDIRDRYKINNVADYIRGTIYPDSRYVSGIDRKLTHNEKVLSSDFAVDDFTAGWQAHQICDNLQGQVFASNIPGFTKLSRHLNHDEWWTNFTAAKIVADMRDSQSFNIQPTLEYLSTADCPNGEDPAKVNKYYQIIASLYRDKSAPSLEDYCVMWQDFKLSDELVDGVRESAIRLLRENVRDIESCYEKMILLLD